jgi:hypothetical protein
LVAHGIKTDVGDEEFTFLEIVEEPKKSKSVTLLAGNGICIFVA